MIPFLHEHWSSVYAVGAYLIGFLMGVGFFRERELHARARRLELLERERRQFEHDQRIARLEREVLP